MRTPKGKSYCSDIAQMNQYLKQIKFIPCPHCGLTGYLIGHGYLRGYSESGQAQVVRGRRFFCSNRYRKNGCGHTFSVMLASVVRRFSVRATTLWQLLQVVADGFNINAGWQRVRTGFSVQTGYRLWRRFERSQTHIRTLLCRIEPPPDSDSQQPLIQLIQHFKAAFAIDSCPLEGFQIRFQQSFLQ